jgi:DNA-binding response OmpR family regulator
MRLLLVEDDTAIQQFLKRALVEAGFKVDTAGTANAGEALALEGIRSPGHGLGLGLCMRLSRHPAAQLSSPIVSGAVLR